MISIDIRSVLNPYLICLVKGHKCFTKPLICQFICQHLPQEISQDLASIIIHHWRIWKGFCTLASARKCSHAINGNWRKNNVSLCNHCRGYTVSQCAAVVLTTCPCIGPSTHVILQPRPDYTLDHHETWQTLNTYWFSRWKTQWTTCDHFTDWVVAYMFIILGRELMK